MAACIEPVLDERAGGQRRRHDYAVRRIADLRTGRELKMGTAFDTFGSGARTANATGEMAANRERLKRAMEAEGFTSAPEAWWRFSYAVPDPMRFDLVIR